MMNLFCINILCIIQNYVIPDSMFSFLHVFAKYMSYDMICYALRTIIINFKYKNINILHSNIDAILHTYINQMHLSYYEILNILEIKITGYINHIKYTTLIGTYENIHVLCKWIILMYKEFSYAIDKDNYFDIIKQILYEYTLLSDDNNVYEIKFSCNHCIRNKKRSRINCLCKSVIFSL